MKQPTLREILNNYYDAIRTLDMSDVSGLRYEGKLEVEKWKAEQAIKDLLLSRLPKEKREPATANPLQGMIELAEVDGYNQAIQEIIKIIEGL